MAAEDHFAGAVDEAWLAQVREEILEPELPIVDPHHHLWSRPNNVYLFAQLLVDVNAGHNIRATVFEECRSMYRADGPREMRSLGETEFVTGVAAMSASGGFGPARLCAGIVGNVDLMLGDRAEPVFQAHIAASGGRFRAIRYSTAWDADPRVVGAVDRPGLLTEGRLREGFKCLARLGLSFDAWVYHPQLDEVAELAGAFPDTPIVLNHFGGPILGGPNAGREADVMSEWRAAITKVAAHENVYLKLGALPVRRSKAGPRLPLTSEEIAAGWRPFFDFCIEKFGPRRCMFESNFPVQKRWSSYTVLWNACKRLAASASADDKAALFSGTALRAYGLSPALV